MYLYLNSDNQSAIILEMRIMCVLRNKQGNGFLLKVLDEEGICTCSRVGI